MLELDKLIFATDTSQLDTAVKKLGDLQTAVVNLNKPIKQTTVETEKLAQAQAKTSKANSDAATAAAKAELAQVRLEKATEVATKTASSNTSVLERQQKILEFMTQGMSKGQASTMAYADATGILDREMQQLRNTLESQRKLLGSEPFDKSLGAIKVMKNELGALRESQRQYNSGVELTVKQAKDLYREKFRLIEAMKIERDRAKEIGDNTLSESQRYAKLKQDLRAINTEYVSLAKQRNRLADDESLQQAQRRIDNLSRGLAPQISDVAVSLYGGMSPMTVLMQQGLQVRDLIQSSGVEADKLNEVLKKTGADFLGTLTGTFKAVGSLVVGVFQSAGKSVMDYTMQIIPADFLTRKFSESLVTLGFSAEKVESSVGSFSRLMSGVFGATLALAATTVIGIVVAFKQLSDEQSALAKTTAQFGGALGLTAVDAKTLTDSVSVLGVSSSKATSILAEMGKAGNLGSESFKAIATSAVDAQKYVGISVETTVKNFSDLLKDPVKVLTKFGIETGYVNAEQIKLVETLLKSGQTSEANAKAVELLQNAYVKMSAEAKGSLSGLDLALIAISSSTGTAWDTFKNSDAVITSLNAVATVIKTVADGAAFLALGVKTVATVVAAINAPEGVSAGSAFDTMKSQLQDYVNEYQNYRKELWEGSKQNSQMSSEEKKAASEKVAAMEAQRKLEKSLGLETKDRIKELTRAQYITLSVEKERIAAGKGAIVTMDLMKDAAKKYGEEWDKAHKQRAKKEDTAGIAAMWEKVSSAVNKANQSYDEVVNGVQVYTNSQKIMIDLLDDPAFLKQPEILQKEALARLAVAHATEKQTQEVKDLWEAEKRVILETFKSEAEVDALRIAREQRGDSEIINAQNKLELLNEELADMMLQKAIYGELTVEQKKQIEYAKVQKEYKAEELRIAKLLADPKNGIDEKSAEYLRNQNYEAAAKKRQNIDQAIILENLKFEESQRKEIAMAFGEAIATSLFEGGKAGTKKLKSFIESELRNRITLQIQANVETSMKGNTGANQLVQAGANFGSTLSTKGLGSAVEGGFMDAGAFLFNNGFKDFGNSLLDLGNSLGEFSSVVDSTVGYLGAFNTASEGDYGAAIGEALGTYFGGPIGAAIGKEIGSWLGLTEGGGTAHMGGYGAYSASGSVKGSTLRGAAGAQFGLADDSIKAASNTMLAGVAQGIVSILDDTANAFGKQAGYYAATSFADDTSDDGAWGALAIKLGDKVLTDWADTQTSRWAPKEFADGEAGLKQYQDALAKSTLDTLNSMGLPEWAAAMLSEIGDNPTMESLTKTISEISAVKDTLTGIGEVIADVFGNAATSSEDAVVALSKVSGGLDKLANNLSGYYSNFYTEEEQLANLRKAASEEFTKLGETLPSTREEFRSMVAIAQMLGDSNKVASLLKFQDAINELVPTFDEVTNALKEARDNQVKLEKEVFDERYGLETRLATVQENTTALRQRELDKIHPLNQELQKYVWMLEDAAEATKKVNELTKAISESYTKDLEKTINELEKAFEVTDNAMSQLEAAVDAEKKAIDTQVNSLEKTKDTLKNVFETLDEAIKSLYDSVKSTTAKNYNEARAILTRAAGGEKIASATLLPAVSTAVAGVNSRVYSSRFEQDKASILLANELSIIKDNTESQMTDVEKQLNALETQSKLLDSQLETAKTSLDALRGIDGTLISVQAALDKLGSSSLSEKVAREQINAAKQQIAMIEKFSSSQEESLKANLDELIKVAFNTDSIVDVLSKLPDSIADLMKESIQTIANDFAKQSGSRMTDSQLQSVIDSVVSGKQTVGSATSEILRSSVTDSNIADFIKSINLEAADSAQIIAAKAKEFGVSLEDIARSTGYSLDMVGSFLRNGGVSSVDMQALSRNSSNLTATGGVISTATATKVLRNLLNQGDFLGAYNLAKQEGFTLAGVDYLGGYPSGTSASWAAMNGLPAFATGTNYVPSDMIAQIHEGEMIVPKKFNPEAIGNTASDEKELEMLRYELRAVAQHTAKLSKAIDRLTVGTNEGDALQVRVAV